MAKRNKEVVTPFVKNCKEDGLNLLLSFYVQSEEITLRKSSGTLFLIAQIMQWLIPRQTLHL